MQGDQTLHQLIKSLYGVSTTPLINDTVAAVGIAAILIAPMNPRRVGFTVVNNGLLWLRILPAPNVTAVNGIYIAPAGGALTLRWDIDFEIISLPWYGIAGGAANAVTVIENISY
jgi:hypothetical protein